MSQLGRQMCRVDSTEGCQRRMTEGYLRCWLQNWLENELHRAKEARGASKISPTAASYLRVLNVRRRGQYEDWRRCPAEGVEARKSPSIRVGCQCV